MIIQAKVKSFICSVLFIGTFLLRFFFVVARNFACREEKTEIIQVNWQSFKASSIKRKSFFANNQLLVELS